MSFFKCKVCLEKDSRIAELKEQVAYFKSLLNPAPRITKYELEADNILNGANVEQFPEPILHEVAEQERLKNEAIQFEQDLILTGSYN